MEPKDLLLHYARDPTNAAIFNYASMAWNNHFFFKGIVRPPFSSSRPHHLRHLRHR